METPNDINGVRTELVMQNINHKIYNGFMPVHEYNQMYMIVYESLKKISIKNLHRSIREMGIDLFDTSKQSGDN